MTQTVDGDWFKSRDGTICVRTGVDIATVPRAYTFYKLVKKCVDAGDIKTALEYAKFDVACNTWAKGSPITYTGTGKLLFDGGMLPAILQDGVLGRMKDGMSAACVTAAVIRAVTMLERHSDAAGRVPQLSLGRTRVVVPQMTVESLLSPEQCEIAYEGWLVYLNRHGRTILDRNDDTGELLVKSNQNGRVVLIADCPTGKVVTLPVGDKVKTCAEAQEWLAGNTTGQGELAVPLPPLSIITRL
jgi:hypothetical protein